MKKLIISLVLIGACRSTNTTTMVTPSAAAGGQPGAPDPISAVTGFMNAAKRQDFQGMSVFWGDSRGAARDQIPRDELQKREHVMMCYLRHDQFDVVGDAPTPGGGRAVALNVTLGALTRSTNLQLVRGPSNRWYVQDIDVKALQEICAQKG